MSLTISKRLLRRKFAVKKKIYGCNNRPRVSIYRSLKHIYAQIIDDEKGHTLVAVSTLSPGVKKIIAGKKKTDQARIVGELLAESASSIGIKNIVFDRAGYKYHGRIKALADAARSKGLIF